MMELFDKIVDTDLTVRRINIAALNLIPEDDIPSEVPYQMNLFTDYEAIEKQKLADAATDQKEKNLQKATLKLQEKYGKNAILKGTNLQEGATTIQRNNQIGGHNSGEV
jgi:DNA polymerase V